MLSFVWRNKKLENIHLPNFRKKKKKTKAEANSKWEEGRRKIELMSAGPQNQSQHHKKQRGHSLTIGRHILQLRMAEKYCAHLFHTFPSCNHTELERRGAVPTGLSGWAHGWKPMVLDTNILHQFLRIQMDQPLKNITWRQIKEGILSHILFHQMLPPTPWETET